VISLQKRLSVIIVSWNSEKFLGECLSSLDNLRFNDMETIVVDSASQDGTVKLLRRLEKSEMGKRLGLIVHYSATNIGWTKGTEEGVRVSSGRWLLSCNPDIGFTRDFEELLSYAESHKFLVLAPSLVTPTGHIEVGLRKLTTARLFVGFTNLGQSFDRLIARGFISRDFHYANPPFKKPFRVDHPPASFFLMHRDVLPLLGDYLLPHDLPLYFGDSDLFTRLQKLKIAAVLLPSVKISHQVSYSKTLVSPETYQYRMTQSMMKYAKKWRLHSRFLALLVFLDAMFAPFISFPHVVRPPRRRDISQSAYRLKGLISS
jgi:GT2 family glycosyltransferase